MFTTGDMTGLLLVGHGTRDRIGRSEFFQVCELVAQRVEIPVRPCFLELADPTIEQAVEELLAYGVNRILVVPLLLFAAGHVKRDIPTAVQAAVRGRVQIQQAAQLGCHPSLVQLSAIRFREAADRLKYPPSCTVSVLVGRGSRDPSATADMARFVGLRQEFVEARRTLHGFIAMASPSIEEVLQHTGNNTSSPIIVQPHLLFLWELRGWETFLFKAKQAQVNLLRARLGSPDLVRSELPRETSHALSTLSIRTSSARSEEGSGSYKSAWSSPTGSPLTTSNVETHKEEAAPRSPRWDEDHLTGVEIGAGAGTIHGFDLAHSATLPFGSGSPTGLPYSASRLTWGHLAREIADLNSRYFV